MTTSYVDMRGATFTGVTNGVIVGAVVNVGTPNKYFEKLYVMDITRKSAAFKTQFILTAERAISGVPIQQVLEVFFNDDSEVKWLFLHELRVQLSKTYGGFTLEITCHSVTETITLGHGDYEIPVTYRILITLDEAVEVIQDVVVKYAGWEPDVRDSLLANCIKELRGD